jgi:polyhydroxybutyrate depolymerase
METLTRFSTQADQAGFVVAYPSFEAGTNNDEARKRTGPGPPLPDIAYLSGLIDKLIVDEDIDPARVYVTGISAGGVMAHRAGCELADKISAVGSVAGALTIQTCQPARPISLMEVHGTADRQVPYNGDSTTPPTVSTIARWRGMDGCPATGSSSSHGAVTTQVWTSCARGTAGSLATITGGTHTWPGSSATGGGAADTSIDATATLWNFFQAHAIPLAASARATSRGVTFTKGPLRAGTYVIAVSDRAARQNLHLVGPGVNRKTGLAFKGAALWTVVLQRGTYRYYSDGSKRRATLRVQ